MAIGTKMEFLNNYGAHNLCEQDSNNFICVNLFLSMFVFSSFAFVQFSWCMVFFSTLFNCISLEIIINFRKTKMLNTWLVVVVHNHMSFDAVCILTISLYSIFDFFCCSHQRCARHRHHHRADISIYLIAILYLVPPLFCCYWRI